MNTIEMEIIKIITTRIVFFYLRIVLVYSLTTFFCFRTEKENKNIRTKYKLSLFFRCFHIGTNWKTKIASTFFTNFLFFATIFLLFLVFWFFIFILVNNARDTVRAKLSWNCFESTKKNHNKLNIYGTQALKLWA